MTWLWTSTLTLSYWVTSGELLSLPQNTECERRRSCPCEEDSCPEWMKWARLLLPTRVIHKMLKRPWENSIVFLVNVTLLFFWMPLTLLTLNILKNRDCSADIRSHIAIEQTRETWRWGQGPRAPSEKQRVATDTGRGERTLGGARISNKLKWRGGGTALPEGGQGAWRWVTEAISSCAGGVPLGRTLESQCLG